METQKLNFKILLAAHVNSELRENQVVRLFFFFFFKFGTCKGHRQIWLQKFSTFLLFLPFLPPGLFILRRRKNCFYKLGKSVFSNVRFTLPGF